MRVLGRTWKAPHILSCEGAVAACKAERKSEGTCGFLHAASWPSGRGAGRLHGVSGTFLTVPSPEARAAPPFQLCHRLVPGDVSGSDIHTITAEEKRWHLSLLAAVANTPSPPG